MRSLGHRDEPAPRHYAAMGGTRTPVDTGAGTVQLQRLPNTDSYCLILPPNLKSAISAVTYMTEQLKRQDTDATMTGDWQFIALVVDRLFLWLFVIITTLGTLAMFLDASFNCTPDDPFP
ncbi:unnamed protein product [Pleuronectes platessa]|uniref:Neurotransmitter-gated ion-channel transmembrane domain-containing protein n=1 Tax=Pleuronectes platessa TaxID=8262 RepID=A0A9N7Z5S9_PLEPL|nr:unnamed protein product [Pleuronectes platessa]